MEGYQEMGSSPDTKSAGTLSSSFQNSETDISVVYKLPCVWYFVLAAEMDWDRVSDVTESVCVYMCVWGG